MSYNHVLTGDCLDILCKNPAEIADLVYLDPPFFTQRVHAMRTRDNGDEFEFNDMWSSLEEYLEYLSKRLSECRRIMTETGSIVVHCDTATSHRIRVLLDELFGEANFRDEIVWSYRRWSNSSRGLLNNQQRLLFYSKTGKYKFNTLYEPYSPTTNVDQLLQARTRDHRNKSVYARESDGAVVAGAAKRGVPMSNVWTIPFLNPKAKERIGYPTQKPLILMERVINLLTNKGDVVVDPFCGSGTTLVAAKLLDRRFIGIDQSEKAVQLSVDRLIKSERTRSRLLESGDQAYLTHSGEITSLLNILGATPVYRNRGIDGLIWRENHELIAVRIQRDFEGLNEAAEMLWSAAVKRRAVASLLVRTWIDRAEKATFPLVSVIDHPQLSARLSYQPDVGLALARAIKV